MRSEMADRRQIIRTIASVKSFSPSHSTNPFIDLNSQGCCSLLSKMKFLLAQFDLGCSVQCLLGLSHE